MFTKLFLGIEPLSFQCQICEMSKSHYIPYPFSNKRLEVPFAIIHSDVWVCSITLSYFGFKWSVNFIDDFMRTTWIYLLKEKSKVALIKKLSQNDSNLKQVLRTNNEKEYFNSISGSFFFTSLSLEGYCTSLSGVFLVYSVCGRKRGKNSVLGRFVVGGPTFGNLISRTI